MEKLKLEHLAPYLPYGLQFIAFNEKWQLTSVGFCPNYPIWANNYWSDIILEHYPEINVKDNSSGRGFTFKEIKPILRPLSDLTKEIEHNGEKFVFSDVYLSNATIKKIIGQEYSTFNNFLNDVDYNSIQLLFKYHFDVFGLIDKGLAIDINTV